MRKRQLLYYNRLWFVFAIFVLIGVVFILRLYNLQIVHGNIYAKKAEHQYVGVNNDLYERGNIFFREVGGVFMPSATIHAVYDLAVNPKIVKDSKNLYKKLDAITSIDSEQFKKKVQKEDDPYEILKRNITKEELEKIEKLENKSVIISTRYERYYPFNNIAASTIGFVGYDAENMRVGRYGIERYYDDILRRNSDNVQVNFFAQLFTDLGKLIRKKKRPGDIILTIDSDIQMYVEEQLEKTRKKWRSKMVGAIVMDPYTGDILSIATTPGFDLNHFNKVNDAELFSNNLISGVYEMGSIVKVLTMAAGLDTGAITKNTRYNDTGNVTLNGATIHNYDFRARGVVPMQEVLSQSLNVGAAFIARKVGHDKMREYFLDKFKLGEETGIDLPDEAHGMIKNIESEREIEFATASFGQGVAFTPIATIRALAAVANGGYLVQPHIVKSIKYTIGPDTVFDYSDQKEKILKKETSEIIAQMLTKVVDTVLSHGDYKHEHYSIAVKTGTAQLVKRGKYREDAYLHTYIGYAPSYNPRFIILLMNLEPHGAKYASQTLTEPFMNISDFMFNYLDVVPDR
jgi:cell division protein FtsI/penicillin-binding protein 2